MVVESPYRGYAIENPIIFVRFEEDGGGDGYITTVSKNEFSARADAARPPRRARVGELINFPATLAYIQSGG